MRACEQCGLSLGDSATFCTVCGARVDPAASPAMAATGASTPQSTPQSASMGRRRCATSGLRVHDVPAEDAPQDAASRRLRDAALPMHEAGDVEKTDPSRAVALYRESILRLLEAAADPLDHETVRHDLLMIFDRLSLVLKREGQPEEALEEIDSAAVARSARLPGPRDQGASGGAEEAPGKPASLPGRYVSPVRLTVPRPSHDTSCGASLPPHARHVRSRAAAASRRAGACGRLQTALARGRSNYVRPPGRCRRW